MMGAGFKENLQRLVRAACLVPLCASFALAQEAFEPAVQVMVLQPAEGRAVLRIGAGETAIHRVGDELAGGRFTLRRVGRDHVVLVERADEGAEAAEIWVYVADASGKSRVQRVARTAPRPPVPETRTGTLEPRQ